MPTDKELDSFVRYISGYIAKEIYDRLHYGQIGSLVKNRWKILLQYCITPPIIPHFSVTELDTHRKNLHKKQIEQLGDKLCFVCGKVHHTSDECGKEPREVFGVVRTPSFAEKLETARLMQVFDDDEIEAFSHETY